MSSRPAMPGASSPLGRRRSLRAQWAAWMLGTTLFTLASFAVIAYGLVKSEDRETISDAESRAEGASEQILGAMLLAAPPAVLLALVGGLWLSRRALGPIKTVVAEANAITAQSLHRRLTVPPQNDELRDLALALNSLLARLAEGFAALGRYAASASHELRTPIAVISSELEIALRRPRSQEEWEQVAGTGLDELTRLTRLIERLLLLNHIGAALGTAHQTSDVGEELERALGPFVARMRQAGVRLVRPTNSIQQVAAPPELLETALRELISNALRYSPRDGTISIDVEQSNEFVDIFIDDSGPGVAAERRTEIFLPFARGEPAPGNVSPHMRGFGLGLAIVKQIAEASGGGIDVALSPFGGARFALRLRAAANS